MVHRSQAVGVDVKLLQHSGGGCRRRHAAAQLILRLCSVMDRTHAGGSTIDVERVTVPHHAPHGGAPPCCSANCRRILANRASGGSFPWPHMIHLEEVEQGGAAKGVWDGAVQRVVIKV